MLTKKTKQGTANKKQETRNRELGTGNWLSEAFGSVRTGRHGTRNVELKLELRQVNSNYRQGTNAEQRIALVFNYFTLVFLFKIRKFLVSCSIFIGSKNDDHRLIAAYKSMSGIQVFSQCHLSRTAAAALRPAFSRSSRSRNNVKTFWAKSLRSPAL
jgi:hypothetical protein